jgi:hypothetical protein
MISQQERARLMEACKHPPMYAAAALIKSVVCLFIIGGLAVIGARSDFSGEAAQPQAQQVRDRSHIITASVRCPDHALSVSAQQPAKLGAVSGDSADAPHQPFVLVTTAIKSC